MRHNVTNDNATKARIKRRLEAWLELADQRHWADGKSWYANANTFAHEVSAATNTTLNQVVGVIAALSPSVYWDQNRRQAQALCQAHANSGNLLDVVVTTYGRQARKARRILEENSGNATEIMGILGRRAFKTRAFFFNIQAPGSSDFVTIDQHIIAACGLEDIWTQSARWCYELVSDVIREIAREHSLRPHQVQAVIWLVYKDVSGNDEPRLPF